MSRGPDLDGYFERVGYSGRAEPTLATLQALHALHPGAIAFDGLSPFLGEPVSLELEALQHKLVKSRRGGYCFEHNMLFWRVLEAIGFQVTGVSARVRLNWPESVVTPRGHMALLVTLPEGQYIADVGFGKLTVTAAVRLETGPVQRTPHEPVRIVERSSGVFALQAELAAEWQTLYTFELQQTFLPDYEIYNWFYSAHPESPFVRGIMMARAQALGRLALLNCRYSAYGSDGRTQSRLLSSPKEFRDTLEHDFGVCIPWNAQVKGKLAALIAAQPRRTAT